ncbi:MAG: hypothetical protein IPM51_04660 [Sphingobacteriaceae bacterium]|nr:hypothetical protein [Sphingobacteriaceae bacterium]
MRFFKKTWLIIALLLAFFACRKSTIATWDVDVVFPILKSELNIKNFFGDTIFKTDNNGLLHLAATRTITAIKLDSLISLPDTTIVTNFTIPAISYTLNAGQFIENVFLQPSELTFSVGNGAQLKTVAIRTGKLKVTYSNGLTEPLRLIYTVPNAVKSGQLFTIDDVIPPGNNSLVKEYSMNGFVFNLKTGNLYNTVIQTYSIQNAGAQPVIIPFGAGVTAEISYADIVPEYAEGFFGQNDIEIKADTTKLDIIKSFTATNFMLADANLEFRILNEFGCEFSGNLSDIKSINGNSIIALSTNQLSNLNINRATRSGSQIYPSVRTTSLLANNSNIVPFLSNLPDKLTYKGNITVNPLGNLSGYNDFAYYNTGIKVLADIDIPLKYNANSFKLVSTTKIDFGNVTQLDNVNYGQFIISALNGYPFSAKLQAFILDKNGIILDSLFVNGLNTIAGGSVNNLNEVIASSSTKINVPLTQEKIQHLKSAEQVRIETVFIMPPNPPEIKILENYLIDLNLVAELNYTAKRK